MNGSILFKNAHQIQIQQYPFICSQKSQQKTIFLPNPHLSNGAIKTPTQLTENPQNWTKTRSINCHLN